MANAVEATEIAVTKDITEDDQNNDKTLSNDTKQNDCAEKPNDKDSSVNVVNEEMITENTQNGDTSKSVSEEKAIDEQETKSELVSEQKSEPDLEVVRENVCDPEPEPEIMDGNKESVEITDSESKQESNVQLNYEEDGEVGNQEALSNSSPEELEMKDSGSPERENDESPKYEHEQEPETEIEGTAEVESEEEADDELDEEELEGEVFGKVEKPLDDDQDRRNPQYIPKGGAFYEHDNRTSLEDVENKDPQELEKKKRSLKESKESQKWLHDCYNESEQLPKSTKEIIDTYGYDIRNEDAPPRARRRRKYGRGPDKYERNWEDGQAYLAKPNNISRRVKKKSFGKDEFPPLPNQKQEPSQAGKSVQKTPPRRREEDSSPKYRNLQMNGNDRPSGSPHSSRQRSSPNQNQVPSFNANKKSYSPVNKRMEEDVKQYRNDGNKWRNNFKSGKPNESPKPIKSQMIRHSDPPFKKSGETNKSSMREPDISQITDGISQMTFHNRQSSNMMRDNRQKIINSPQENKIKDVEVESPANRQNPKRYSKIRKGYTGVFSPEEVPEIDQADIDNMQQQIQKNQHMNMTQPLNVQNVIKRYSTYDFVPGNTNYLGGRPIMSGIPQQGMSPQGMHQQALSPQGIPQQALSPQVTGLQTLDMQQNPLGQPNFVPQTMYIDMDAHYTSDVMGPYSAYPPYSGNQTGDVYQAPRGITYYNTECQNSGQKRPPPPRRQKAAIPIVRPPE